MRLTILLRRNLYRCLYYTDTNFLSYQLWSCNRYLFFSQLQLRACDGEFETDQQCTVMETEVRLRINVEEEPTFDFNEWETSFTGKCATANVFIRFYICLCIKILYYNHILSHPFKKLTAISEKAKFWDAFTTIHCFNSLYEYTQEITNFRIRSKVITSFHLQPDILCFLFLSVFLYLKEYIKFYSSMPLAHYSP